MIFACGSSPLARGLLLPGRILRLTSGIIPARAGFTRRNGPKPNQISDHPRSRGVYHADGVPAGGPQGSSPLARGLLLAGDFAADGAGIIPARAGFTNPHPHSHFAVTDHPRSRGVYLLDDDLVFGLGGSSPLARGLREAGVGRDHRRRIIPARAGFTWRRRGRRRRWRDHPRSRGVYGRSSIFRTAATGSSPLARGLHLPRERAGPLDGIIPARAGFTFTILGDGIFDRDHPRSRGVYLSLRGLVGARMGSSPLARGLLARGLGEDREGGIIPARAGFTLSRARACAWVRDHPRSRGVYYWCMTALQVPSGSSPLARGLLNAGLHVIERGRIIPARAGFTPPPTPPSTPPRDHPRSRGVYDPCRQALTAANGSSPLARGLPAGPAENRLVPGIIPARAGFTLADPWNPNEPTLYQTPAAFTADLGPAPPGRDSAVEFGAALSTAGRAGRDLAAAGLRPWFGHPPDTHRRVATTSG